MVLGDVDTPSQARLSLPAELREASFTVVAITLSSVFAYAVTQYALQPLQLSHLRTPVIVATTALAIVTVRFFIDTVQQNPRHRMLALLTNQCTLIGIALFSVYHANSMLEAISYGLGAAVALVILNAAFTALMERINTHAIPFVFRGIPSSLITAGLMALALMGFAGIVRN